MKFIRTTLWQSPDDHAHVVMAPTDSNDALDDVFDDVLAKIAPPGAFFTLAVFEHPAEVVDPAVVQAAMRLFDGVAEDERNMAILYFFDAATLLRIKPHGMLASTEMAPLTADQVEFTLKQLARHPNYQHQSCVTMTKDLMIVSMKDGVVFKEPR